MSKVHLFYIRTDALGYTEYIGEETGKIFEPYAFTYDKGLATSFISQRCPRVFRYEKDFVTPKEFALSMQMIEIPLTTTHRQNLTIVGTMQEESQFQIMFDTFIDKMGSASIALENALENNLINPRGFTEMNEIVGTIEDQAMNIDTYHMFYDLYKRSFIDPIAWDDLAKDPILKSAQYWPYSFY